MRSALLTSISHDLRTPLASILGSATSLRSYRQNLDDVAQDELIATIQDEAERLNRFINNLLDMTRLESGHVTVRIPDSKSTSRSSSPSSDESTRASTASTARWKSDSFIMQG